MNLPTDPTAAQPLATACSLPAEAYCDPAMVARDRAAVFAASWQLVGHAGRIPASGDHLLADVAGIPVVLLRDEAGAVRAFHNVCRHRAGPLVLGDGCGLKRLRCRYHGWTYGLDGVLRAAPEMAGVEDFDPARVRLPELAVTEWQGLLFVAAGPAPPFAEFVAGIDQRLGGQRFDGFRFDRRVAYELDCNWKVYVDNYLEGYHVPHIHPGLNKLLDYRSYVTEVHRWYSLQYSPLESEPTLYGSGEALYWFVWPNLMLNVLPDRLQTNLVLPLGEGRCRVVFDYFYPASADPATLDARHAEDHRFSDLVQVQDVGMCETVQRNLASGSYVAGRLNPARESGVHHFHELLRAAYRGP